MSLVSLIERAEDLGNYGPDGTLWIFRRPNDAIDLSLHYVLDADRFVGTAADGTFYVEFTARTREDAVKGALDEMLDGLSAYRASRIKAMPPRVSYHWEAV